MKSILLILVIAVLIIISACDNSNNINSLNEKEANPCDDKNECTLDAKNSNGECINAIMQNCCGNNICEINERCNQLTRISSCSNDCELCPAEIKTRFLGCNGECTVNADGSIVSYGNSNLEFEIENLGETNINILPEFACIKSGQGIGKINLAYYGLNVQDSISENLLNGKSKLKYTVNLQGISNSKINLECSANFKYNKDNHFETIFLRLQEPSYLIK